MLNLLLHRILAWPRAQEGLLAAICKIEKIKQFALNEKVSRQFRC